MKKKDVEGPADTRMMGIVHDALRRDLARLRAALTTEVGEGRRQALAAHVAWMTDFLHAHHEGEDAGLYPMVRAADPACFGPGYRRRAAARWAGAGGGGGVVRTRVARRVSAGGRRTS